MAGFGLVCLYSALRGSLVVPVNILNKQIVLLFGAVAVGAVVSQCRERWLHALAFPALIAGALGLIAVLIPGIGVSVNGARRWIDLGISHFQVSELAKALFLVGFAYYLARYRRHRRDWLLGFLVPMAIIAVYCGLIIKEPDFGTAFLFAAVGGTMLFLWGARVVWLVGATVPGLAWFFYMIWEDPVRWKRIVSFLDVEGNKTDGAYQLYQGILAFGAGGATGVGIGNGRQQLAYLPEAHTDFILPVIGEELGMIATLSIVSLYGLLFLSIAWIARTAGNVFWYLLAAGGGCFVVYQALFNVCVVTGLVPTKGISLPFISYGGANLLASFLILGLIVCARKHSLNSPILGAREI